MMPIWAEKQCHARVRRTYLHVVVGVLEAKASGKPLAAKALDEPTAGHSPHTQKRVTGP